MKSFLREDPTAAGRGIDDNVIAKLFEGGRVVDHDLSQGLSQGDEGVASIQATSGENTPQGMGMNRIKVQYGNILLICL